MNRITTATALTPMIQRVFLESRAMNRDIQILPPDIEAKAAADSNRFRHCENQPHLAGQHVTIVVLFGDVSTVLTPAPVGIIWPSSETSSD
jgi:hypothetical protein